MKGEDIRDTSSVRGEQIGEQGITTFVIFRWKYTFWSKTWETKSAHKFSIYYKVISIELHENAQEKSFFVVPSVFIHLPTFWFSYVSVLLPF